MNLPLANALKIALRIQSELAVYCEAIEIAGSIRRQRPTVNDIDFVCIAHDRAGLESRIRQHCNIRQSGPQAIIADLPNGFQIDLWLAHHGKKDLLDETPTNFGTLQLCRTGSKQFNIWFALQAQKKELHWNPHHGLFAGKGLIASSREADLFAALDIPFIPPEDRER